MGSITPETLYSSSSSLSSPTTGSDSSSSSPETGRSTNFLCGLHNKLKLKKALRKLIKEQNQKILSLTNSLAEKTAEAKKWKELYSKRMAEEENKSQLPHDQAGKDDYCGTSSSDNHFKNSQKISDGKKPWYDEDYVSGHASY